MMNLTAVRVGLVFLFALWAQDIDATLIGFRGEVERNEVTVMSFNIHHDLDDWWMFEIAVGNDSGTLSSGRVPRNYQDAAVRIVTSGGTTRMIFMSDRAHRVIRAIESEQPMLVGFQEAYKTQAQIVAHALRYKVYARGREEDSDHGETVAIVWNPDKVVPETARTFMGIPLPDVGTFWYSDHPDEPGSITDNADWGHPELPRICSWGRFRLKRTGRTFYLFNTHLQNDGNATDGERNRMKSVELLLRRIAGRSHPSSPVIVTGDFNDQPTTAPIDLMTTAAVSYDGKTWTNPTPMTDTFGEKNATSTTGSKCSGGGPTGNRIDYVFRWPSMTTLRASIMVNPPGAGCPSDHLPVMARLSLVGGL